MREVNLKNKTVDLKTLEKFGFTMTIDGYVYEKKICDEQLTLTLIFNDGKLFSRVIDSNGEEYTLHLAESSVGSFVGAVRQDYEKILTAFIESCCAENVFCEKLTKNLLEYVQEKYRDEPEFLWKKFPNYAVLRRNDTQKWYAVIMEISERKLNLDSDNEVEILNLRGSDVENLLDGKKYFPAYHMNKKSWYTIKLDGTVDFDEICTRLNESYKRAIK